MSNYSQWQIKEDGTYGPCYSTTAKLPAGIFEIRATPRNEFYLKRQNVITDGIIDLPMPEMQGVLNDIKKFWDLEEVYRNSRIIHKRGILLFGVPGSGKSVIIQRLIQNMIEKQNGIVINVSTWEEIEHYVKFCPEILRIIEPTRKILVVLEDLDSLIWRGTIDTLSVLLNVLDGIHQINNVVYVATTNHISKLETSLTNRPGRFDVKRRIGLPNQETRKYFLEHKLSAEQLKKVDIDFWVKETEGLSIAHLKELIISVLILELDFTKTVESLKKMKEFISAREEAGVAEVGF